MPADDEAKIDEVLAALAPTDLADKARVSGFSDNVISIAITLLVLDVTLPGGWVTEKSPHLDLRPVMIYLAPRLMSFVLSFSIVGVYWVAHHQMFRAMRGIGRPVLWINNLFLMTITLIPASAGILSEYPGQTISVFIYGFNVLMVASSLLLLWHYGVTFARTGYSRTIGGVAIYLLGLPVAFISPWAALAVFSLVPLAYITLQARPIAAPAAA